MIKNRFTRGIETLRQPDRNPRCYEMTDEERLRKIQNMQVNVKNIAVSQKTLREEI